MLQRVLLLQNSPDRNENVGAESACLCR